MYDNQSPNALRQKGRFDDTLIVSVSGMRRRFRGGRHGFVDLIEAISGGKKGKMVFTGVSVFFTGRIIKDNRRDWVGGLCVTPGVTALQGCGVPSRIAGAFSGL
ncbi:MAG: hypothetical protein PHQ75_05105 [Thermoguttaceae bacterium]|nr:hypothetical protein [Thermoguttaceae bacterium]